MVLVGLSLKILVPCCVSCLHHILCTACMSLGLNDGSEEARNMRGNAETISSESEFTSSEEKPNAKQRR